MGFDFDPSAVSASLPNAAEDPNNFGLVQPGLAQPADLGLPSDDLMDAAAAFDMASNSFDPQTAAQQQQQPQNLLMNPQQQEQPQVLMQPAQQPVRIAILKQPQQGQQIAQQAPVQLVQQVVPQEHPAQFQSMDVGLPSTLNMDPVSQAQQQIMNEAPVPAVMDAVAPLAPVQDAFAAPAPMAAHEPMEVARQSQQEHQEEEHDEEDDTDHAASSAPAPTPAPAPVGKPAAKRTRRKKDPNAPAAVSSAYAFFFKETQASVKTHNPNAKFGEVSKIVASMWEALDEDGKKGYRKKNEEDKQRYEREMKVYKEKLESGELQAPSEANNQQETARKGRVAATRGARAAAETNKADGDGRNAGLEVMEHDCIRSGCSRKAVRNVEWEDEYCSNECVIAHCKDVFGSWIKAA